ncbi:MAG: DUF3325 domain-containing protein [Rhodanobacter sp.]
MTWVALSMPVHAQQVWTAIPSRPSLRLLRVIGVAGIAIALGLWLAVDHASMAVLVWVMATTGASRLVAITLALRLRWLQRLTPWLHQPRRP